MLVKSPPAYTVEPFNARARTMPLAFGAHEATLRLDRTWATLALATPPTESNAPPMNQPPLPSFSTVLTVPCTFGSPERGWPAGFKGAPPPVAGPTYLKPPPMYNVLPDTAVA